MNQPNLKLLAQDADDLQVVAAVLQDAIVPVCDMAYHAADKSFVMVVQRFRWDCVKEDGKPALPTDEGATCTFERICCALDFEGIEAVQAQGVDQNDSGRMLDLLTIMVEGPELLIIFAGGVKVRLKLGKWRLRLEDFGESWPTPHCPRHST